jgi:colicin import membrane protein
MCLGIFVVERCSAWRRVLDYNSRPPTPPPTEGSNVDQAQFELQLKIWKELAISKQMLVRVVTEALKLDPNAKAEELRQSFDVALKKVAQADIEVAQAKEQAKTAIAEVEKKLAVTLQAQAAAEAKVAELTAALEKATTQIATERATSGSELQKVKVQLVDKEKALKAINTALADTPENVVKRLKALKKEKQDEADARRQVELSFTTLRAEKQKQDQRLTEVGKLITQYRELHELTVKVRDQLKPLVAEEKDVPAVPELDTKLIETIEQGPSKVKIEQRDNSTKMRKAG